MYIKFENLYKNTFKSFLWLLRPFKKILIKTECKVHIFINRQALSILENDKYHDAFIFYEGFQKYLDGGVVWADQDFRSRNHFYNPYTKKGLYGCDNSFKLFNQYYKKAIRYWRKGEQEKAMVFLGAGIHLIQDATIPQHASIHLLRSHRKYEQWIKGVYYNFSYYAADSGGIYKKNPYDYIRSNSIKALSTYNKYKNMNRINRFKIISKILFPLAQKTTAGCLLNFYNSVVVPSKIK